MTTRTIPEVELPATPLAQIQGYGTFTAFLPGDQLRSFRVGDEVTVNTRDGTAKATLTGRTQGTLFGLAQQQGMSYAPVRNKAYDAIAFADALEANLPDEQDPCDMRAFYTVLTFEGVQPAPATPGATAPIPA